MNIPPLSEIREMRYSGEGTEDVPYYIDLPTYRILSSKETAEYLRLTAQEALPETSPPTVAVHVPP